MTEMQRALLQRRLKRRELWISLWLVRMCAFLQVFGRSPRWRDWFDLSLNRLARHVMYLFLCHVILCAKSRKARGFNDPRAPRASISFRAATGCVLRRVFKAKNFKERLEKIRRALENRDSLIALLARRLRRGMTRRAFAHTRAPFGGDVVLLPILHVMPTACADTS